jgi:hypothetical protein
MQIHYENKHPKENWNDVVKLYNKDEEEEDEQYEGVEPVY